MTKEEILAILQEHDTIFGLLRPPIREGTDRVAEISTAEIIVRPKGLFWAGPEGEAKPTLYCYTDYGVTWAFSREEIHPIERTDEARND